MNSIKFAAAFSAGLLSLSAQAADIEVYGVVDTGLVYTREKIEGVKNDSFDMRSGFGTASIFGLAGKEELANGLTASFRLENSFNSDDGSLAEDGLIFDQEAQISLSGGFGTVSFGRMGALTSGDGTYNVFKSTGDAMDGGYGDYIGVVPWVDRGIYNNMITYASPDIGGLSLYAQYSFGTDADGNGSRSNDRYAALGAGFSAGNLNAVLVVDKIYKNRATGVDGAYNPQDESDDEVAASFGVNYDFGSVKPFLGLQYGKHIGSIGEDGIREADVDIDGFTAHLGAVLPLASGELQTSVYYAKGTSNQSIGSDVDAKLYGAAVMYAYPFSDRTSLNIGAGYAKSKVEQAGEADVDADAFQAGVGITHAF